MTTDFPPSPPPPIGARVHPRPRSGSLRLAARFPLPLLACVTLGIALPAAEPIPDLDEWLSHRTNVVSWSAEVRQTRKLKSVARPLVTSGRVWFRAPNLFRWELGQPARTVAIREPTRLVLLYPRLKRAEVYSLDENSQGPWRSSLTLLEAGFPASREQLEAQFNIVNLSTDPPGELLLHLQPKSDLARRWVTRVDVTVSRPTMDLVATELYFSDGSRLRNEFTGASSTEDPADPLFQATIPADYTVTQPSPEP